MYAKFSEAIIYEIYLFMIFFFTTHCHSSHSFAWPDPKFWYEWLITHKTFSKERISQHEGSSTQNAYSWRIKSSFPAMADAAAAIAICSVIFALFFVFWIGSMCYFRTPCKDLKKETTYIEEGNLS